MMGMDENMMSKRVVISGLRGTGKTSLLMALIKEFQCSDIDVKGIVSPGVFDGEKKIAIEMMDLAAGESRLFARLAEETTTDLQFGDWSFSQETLQWANQRLASIESADVLVMDEIGPLELDMKCGLQAGLDLLALDIYRLAVITVRPKCLTALSELLPEMTVYPLSRWDPEALKYEVLRIADVLI